MCLGTAAASHLESSHALEHSLMLHMLSAHSSIKIGSVARVMTRHSISLALHTCVCPHWITQHTCLQVELRCPSLRTCNLGAGANSKLKQMHLASRSLRAICWQGFQALADVHIACPSLTSVGHSHTRQPAVHVVLGRCAHSACCACCFTPMLQRQHKFCVHLINTGCLHSCQLRALTNCV